MKSQRIRAQQTCRQVPLWARGFIVRFVVLMVHPLEDARRRIDAALTPTRIHPLKLHALRRYWQEGYQDAITSAIRVVTGLRHASCLEARRIALSWSPAIPPTASSDLGGRRGVAFDGDADRVVFVDEQGVPLPWSTTTAIVAAWFLARRPGARIVHNLICSRSVAEAIRSGGGVPVRT